MAAQEVAGHDVHRAAHRQARLSAPGVAQVDGDLCSELPMPTTSTRLPRQESALRYRQLCRMGPPNRALPGNSGKVRHPVDPVATTTRRARNAVSSVRTPSRRRPATLDRQHALAEAGAIWKWAA
jgi:hypothetical protein